MDVIAWVRECVGGAALIAAVKFLCVCMHDCVGVEVWVWL